MATTAIDKNEAASLELDADGSRLGLLMRQSSLIPSVLMVFILGLAAFLRFYDLSQRGLVYWDEAKFALEGERMQAYLHALVGSEVPLKIGKSIGTAKPTHAVLIGISYLVFGINDHAALYANAFFSLLGVLLVYFLGRKMFGPWVGVIAALFLAVSEYDVIYARSALSESDAAALLLAAVLCWWIDWERIRLVTPTYRGVPTRYLILAALFAGLSFTANYRMIVYIIALVFFDLVWTIVEKGWRPMIWRGPTWLAGLAVMPLAWVGIDSIAGASGHVLFRREVPNVGQAAHAFIFPTLPQGGTDSYIAQALYQIHGGKQGETRFDPLIYLHWFTVRGGWAIAALVLIGLIITIVTRLFPWFALSALIAIPFAIYTFASFIVPRNLVAEIPFICLIAAAVIVTLAEKLPLDWLRRTAIIAVSLLIAAQSAFMAFKLHNEVSGFTLASQFVAAHGGKALTSTEMALFYLPGRPGGTVCNAPSIPAYKTKLAADLAHGYTYAIISKPQTEVQKFIITNAPPVATYPEYGDLGIGENPVASENGYPPPEGKPITVSVYDMSKLKLPAPGNAKVDTCNRNVPA